MHSCPSAFVPPVPAELLCRGHRQSLAALLAGLPTPGAPANRIQIQREKQSVWQLNDMKGWILKGVLVSCIFFWWI